MKYNIKAHPTTYNGTQFRSRLEARWAAYFDLAGWDWEYEPVDLNGWSPDFRVEFPCPSHSCRVNGKYETHHEKTAFCSQVKNINHALMIEVKPYFNVDDFIGHQCMNYPFGVNGVGLFGMNPDCIKNTPEGMLQVDGTMKQKVRIPADSSAAFGSNPKITHWEMWCNDTPEQAKADWWVRDSDYLWKTAGKEVQYIANNEY